MSTITLDELIKQGEELKSSLVALTPPCHVNTHRWSSEESKCNYDNWVARVTRFLKTNYHQDDCNNEWADAKRSFELILTLDAFNTMLAVLKSCREFPNIVRSKEDVATDSQGQASPITVIQNNNQYITLNLVSSALQESLTPEQLKELKEYLTEIKDQPAEQKKEGIVTKLLNLGANVAPNLVANLLSNEHIIGAFL